MTQNLLDRDETAHIVIHDLDGTAGDSEGAWLGGGGHRGLTRLIMPHYPATATGREPPCDRPDTVRNFWNG